VLASHNLELASAQLVRPGSTLKPFVLLALLDSGKLDPSQHFLCKRLFTLETSEWIAAIRPKSSSQTLMMPSPTPVIPTSLKAASRLGPRELVEALRRAVLDSPTGLGKPEAARLRKPPDYLGRDPTCCLGERGVEVTPLELLEAYRKLALRKRTENTSPPRQFSRAWSTPSRMAARMLPMSMACISLARQEPQLRRTQRAHTCLL